MAISNHKKEQIALVVIKVLYSRFKSFPSNEGLNRNAPFHEAFMQAFQGKLKGRVNNIPDIISLSSWMHGLNTSLGQSFFESVAHILCDGQKRDFKSGNIYVKQQAAISDIMIDLKNGTEKPSLNREDEIIAKNAKGTMQVALNFTADCFYESDDEVVAIELKSVRPNSGEMRGEKQKILIGKAVLRGLYPDKNVKYLFGFPFDPTADTPTGYDKTRFLNYLVEAEKFIAHEDFLIADELWSYLSGSDNSMSEILEIINTIATPEFMTKYNLLQDEKTKPQDKRNILKEWLLTTEVKILDNVQYSTSNARIYNQQIFKKDGTYNTNRLRLLETNN